MTIDTIVLLVMITVWGIVQLASLAFCTKYFDRMMKMCEKVTDVVIKYLDKQIED